MFAALALAVATRAAGAAPPAPEAPMPRLSGFQSSRLELVFGGLRIASTSHPAVALSLANRADRALWIRARLGAPRPEAECDLVGRVEPGREITFTCEQDSLVADHDYPITLTAFADSALADTLETDTATLRFGRREVDMLAGWVQATVLPRTYERVLLQEKLGGMTPLLAGLSSGGTLVVTPDSLTYTRRKRTLSLPATRLRSVSLRQRMRSTAGRWVVVEYEAAGGATRMVAFQPALGGQSEELDYIHASLVALLRRRP